MVNLDIGSIARLKNPEEELVCVVQVVEVKAIQRGKFQAIISDGQDSMSVILTTQLIPSINDKSLRENTVIQILKYRNTAVPNTSTRIIILLEIKILGQQDNPQALSTTAPPAQHLQQPQGNYGIPNTAPAAPTNPYGAMTTAPPTAPPSYGNTNTAPNYGASMSNNRPIYRDDSAGTHIMPISAINPYSGKWTIKARITAKSDIRTWSNARGEGKLFSIDLLDSEGGEIRATFFKDACDKFFPMLEEDKVYTFANGTLKVVQNRSFSHLKNQYELTFNTNAVITASSDDGIKHQTFTFVKIASLANTEVGSTVDLIGVVQASTDCSEIVSSKMGGKVLFKRELTVVDDSQSEVKITLWGEKASAQHFQWESLPIVAFKGLKVGDYGGRSLSTMANSQVLVNPNIPEGHAMHTFRSQFPGNLIPISASLSTPGGGMSGSGLNDPIESRRVISSIKEEMLGSGEKPDYVTVKGSVSYIKHDTDCWYNACPTCSKKVVELGNGQWSCEKCNTTHSNCNRRYLLTLTLADHTGNNWATLFNEQAEKLLGVKAEQLYQYRQAGDDTSFESVFERSLFKTVIARLRVKQEMVNDEQRQRSSCVAFELVDLVDESAKMLAAINKYGQ